MSTLRAPLAIAADHPAYAGHFPGMPVLPGVVLLDEAMHAIGRGGGLRLDSCRIVSAKFASPVAPGEPLEVEAELPDGVRIGGRISFVIMSQGRRIASGVLQAEPE